MILNFGSRWIFILPPKTGSTSLVRLLQSPAFRGVAYETGIPRAVDQHWPWPPPHTEEFRIFLSVRHPVARVVSQYRYYVQTFGDRHPAARSFDAWVDRLTEPRRMPHRSWATTCLGVLPEPLRPRLAGVVRAERMVDDLRALEIARCPFRVPTLNASRGPKPIPSESQVGRILEWGREDLENFYRDTTIAEDTRALA